MAIAVRSTSTLALGTRTNSTVAAPAGATTGDVITVAIGCGGSALIEPTAPAGWTLVESTSYSAPDPWSVSLTMWVKAYAGEANWTFTHASHSTQAFATAWTGVDTATPLDAIASKAFKASGTTNATATAPSITTVTAGAQGIICRGSWDGNPITPPTGWTEQYDAPILWVGRRDFATAGATGTVAVPAGNGDAASPWGVIMGALRPAGSTVPVSASVTAVPAVVTVAMPALGSSVGSSVSVPTAGVVVNVLAPSASVGVSGTVTAARATITAQVLAPSASVSTTVTAARATITAQALSPAASVSATLSAVQAVAAVLALPPAARVDAALTAVPAGLTVTVPTPGVQASGTTMLAVPVVTVTTQVASPAVSVSATVTASTASLAVSAHAPNATTGSLTSVAAATSTVSVQAPVPSVRVSASRVVPSAVLSVTVRAPSLGAAPPTRSPLPTYRFLSGKVPTRTLRGAP